jgi:hypothetical protein
MFPSYIQAESGNQLGYKLVPSKIMENTECVLQVYSMADGISLDKLVATSSDSSIIQIEDLQKADSPFTYNIKIKTMNAGAANIAVAAPGFASQEIPIRVYKNTAGPAQLLIKTTPSTFSTTSPNQGFLTVEIVNNDGLPTPAPSDIPITLTSSDSNIAFPESTQSVIKQGSYYVVEKFDVNKPGTAQLSVSSPSMQPVSAPITVNADTNQYTVQVYVYPQQINAISEAYAYAIVQLHDSAGNPVMAKEDIPVQAQVTNTVVQGRAVTSNSSNTSNVAPVVQINDALVIKKGSYWGYAPVEITGGVSGTFAVNIYTKGYLFIGPATLTTVVKSTTLDTKTAKMDMLPILATGKQELIGIMHLQNPSGNPVLAKGDLQIPVDSSDPTSLTVLPVKMDFGSQAALVFADISNSPNKVTLSAITDNVQTIVPSIKIPTSNSLMMTVTPLIPQVLTHSTFPLAIYQTSNGVLNPFSSDFDFLVSPQESIQISKSSVSKGQAIFLTDATLLKDGSQTISITAPTSSATFTVQGMSSKPQGILLDHPDKIISNTNNLFSMELLNGQQNPIIANQDLNFKLVSSDPSILSVPDTIQINKGSYYKTFKVQSKNGGDAQIAVLADEIPLSNFPVQVISFNPQVSIDSTDRVDPNYKFDATVIATYQQIPISGLNVDWKITGATIQNMDSITDKDGKAKVSLVSNDPSSVTIQATVSGGSYQPASANKQVTVNPPLAPAPITSITSSSTTQQQMFTIMGISPIIFVIPVAAIVVFIILKKREMLEGITEKIGVGEKFSEIKEKVTALRER